MLSVLKVQEEINSAVNSCLSQPCPQWQLIQATYLAEFWPNTIFIKVEINILIYVPFSWNTSKIRYTKYSKFSDTPKVASFIHMNMPYAHLLIYIMFICLK